MKMKLQDFLKKLFSQEAVKGYEIKCIEVDVGIFEGNIILCEGVPNAKITIVSRDDEPSTAPLQVSESLVEA